MPQGRKKVPFSAKAKKIQLQEKRVRKNAEVQGGPKPRALLQYNSSSRDNQEKGVQKINQQPGTRGTRGNSNRYTLQFYRETDVEISARKEAACRCLVPVSEQDLEITIEEHFLPEFDFPKRPPWKFEMSREQLEARENRYFTEYISTLERKFGLKDLSYFELNLETWRQLWRVLEMSDIILIIVDIRFPALMFPPSLYHHVTDVLGKEMILVLNKVDLAPPPLVVAWKHYMQEKYPALHILTFTSFPSYNLRGNQSNKSGLQVRRRKGKQRMAAEGAQKLYEACQEIVKDEVDLTSWHVKICEEMQAEYECDDVEVGETIEVKKVDTSFVEHEKYKSGVLTIGCVGQPNVGKSSLINAIKGNKVVSVSKTPGHTKHFQTIFLTANVRLCDCPGLVFPSKVPKSLQVLMGSFPIAQLRDPFSPIQFLAERIDLPKLLRLQHPDWGGFWSAMEICEAWAQKRGFLTAKAARLDAYRAANNLLRMALDGKICLCLRPPEYSSRQEFWSSHKDVELVSWVQAQQDTVSLEKQSNSTSDSSEGEAAGQDQNTNSEDAGGPSMVTSRNKFSALDQDSSEGEAAGQDQDSNSEDEEGPSMVTSRNKFSVLDQDDQD